MGGRCTDRTPDGHWKTPTRLSSTRLGGVIRATVAINGLLTSIADALRAVNAAEGVNYFRPCGYGRG